MVLFYTSHRKSVQCLAYSLDGGVSFAKHAGNPVLAHGTRDPKVFWFEPTEKWVMVLYEGDGVTFFESPNLLSWVETSHLANNFYECPDLFELAVVGEPEVRKWVLVSGDADYMIGSFDGRRFAPESEALCGDWGNPPFRFIADNYSSRQMCCNVYATQTWNKLPGGRRVQIAHMPQSGWIARGDAPFLGNLTFPCELSLHRTAKGLRVYRYPIGEIERLYHRRYTLPESALGDVLHMRGSQRKDPLDGIGGEALDMRLRIEAGTAREIGLWVHNRPIHLSPGNKSLLCLGRTMPLSLDGAGVVELRLLVDRTSIEIYENQGAHAMSLTVPGKLYDTSVRLFALGGEARLLAGEVREVRSATVASCKASSSQPVRTVTQQT
jgi:sucrose-6-phosphate hydrolase SacC (GH32 family)